MFTHGKGPKDVLVKAYSRWLHGELLNVETHVRGHSHKLGYRVSPLQLDFFGLW